MGSDKHVVRELAKAKFRATAALIGGVAVVLLLVMAFFYGRKLGGVEAATLIQEKEVITEDVLHQQLEAIGELGTVKYYYTNMGKYEKNLSVSGQNIPFTKTSFIISYDGTIKAGIDLKEIGFALRDKVIVVTIPEAKLLSHEVDQDSLQVFDEKNSIFNGLTTEDVTGFEGEQKKTMESRALAAGILEEARANAQGALKSIYQVLVSDDTFEDGYTLEFQ